MFHINNLDMARLRQDLHNEYTLELHCGSSQQDLTDMILCQRGTDEQVLEIANRRGVDLSEYQK